MNVVYDILSIAYHRDTAIVTLKDHDSDATLTTVVFIGRRRDAETYQKIIDTLKRDYTLTIG